MSTVENAPRFAGLTGDEYGTPDGRPPIVLLHGLTFDRTMWRPAVAELETVDPGRRVLALDLPGHGGSVRLPTYRLEDVAEHVHRAITEAGLDEPIVVGHSIAAAIASIYAARHPSSGVVNVDASLRVGPIAEFLHARAGRIEAGGFGELWRHELWPTLNTQLLPLGAQELLRKTTNPEQGLARYWQDTLDRSPEELEAWIAAGLAELREKARPYLVVAGAELEPGYRAWLAEQLPQATVTVLGGSGHFPHLAHPGLFAECLSAFTRWSAWSYA